MVRKKTAKDNGKGLIYSLPHDIHHCSSQNMNTSLGGSPRGQLREPPSFILEKTILMPTPRGGVFSGIKKHLESFEKKGKFPKLLFAEIHITNRCQLRCYFCNQAEIKKANRVELPYSIIKKNLLDMKRLGLAGIVLSGGGEPTLHRSFVRIMEFLKNNQITVMNVGTNGISTNRDIWDSMLAARVQNISFSLHASDEKQWKSITKGPLRSFGDIVKNITYILKQRNSSKLLFPRIAIKFGIGIGTWKKLTQAYELACSLGVDDMMVTTYNHIMYPASVRSNQSILLKQIQKIEEKNKKTSRIKNLVFYLGDLDIKSNFNEMGSAPTETTPCYRNDSDMCFMPWYGIMIAASGDVKPCANGMEVFPSMGNIYNQSIGDIWTGRKFCKLRKLFKNVYFNNKKSSETDNYLPVFCRPHSMEAPCPHKVSWEELAFSYKNEKH